MPPLLPPHRGGAWRVAIQGSYRLLKDGVPLAARRGHKITVHFYSIIVRKGTLKAHSSHSGRYAWFHSEIDSGANPLPFVRICWFAAQRVIENIASVANAAALLKTTQGTGARNKSSWQIQAAQTSSNAAFTKRNGFKLLPNMSMVRAGPLNPV